VLLDELEHRNAPADAGKAASRRPITAASRCLRLLPKQPTERQPCPCAGWSSVPVIALSARSGEGDKIVALDAGADDYLVKPLGAGELMARVRAQLRRHAQQSQQVQGGEPVPRFADMVVDLSRRSVERAGAPLHLTPIEYRLLTHLAGQPDRVVTHRRLLKAVWVPAHSEDTHYVRVHMANLPKKVEAEPSMPKHLVTEAGVGYRFVP